MPTHALPCSPRRFPRAFTTACALLAALLLPPTPPARAAEPVAARVAGGGQHTLALRADGSVWAWGWNVAGQLGDGTIANSSRPVPVVWDHDDDPATEAVPLSGIKALAAGWQHSLALGNDGKLWAWGANSYGQLGDGDVVRRVLPVRVKAESGTDELTDIKALAAGDEHSLALRADGSVWAWGLNVAGQLGDGTTEYTRTLPVPVVWDHDDDPATEAVPLSGIKALAAGMWHSLALGDDGDVWAWGYNDKGQLGDGTTDNRKLPVPVLWDHDDNPATEAVPLSGIKALAAGDNHSLALGDDGCVWAWGYNDKGQLGDGTITNSSRPVRVQVAVDQDLDNIKALAAGKEHSLALGNDGKLWAWGANSYGQLGDKTIISKNRPVRVKAESGTGDLTGIKALAVGKEHSLALGDDGKLWAWGGTTMASWATRLPTTGCCPCGPRGLTARASWTCPCASPPGDPRASGRTQPGSRQRFPPRPAS